MMAKPINTRTAIPDGRGVFLMTSGFDSQLSKEYFIYWPLEPNGVVHCLRKIFMNKFLSSSLSGKPAYLCKLPGSTCTLNFLYLLSWHCLLFDRFASGRNVAEMFWMLVDCGFFPASLSLSSPTFLLCFHQHACLAMVIFIVFVIFGASVALAADKHDPRSAAAAF